MSAKEYARILKTQIRETSDVMKYKECYQLCASKNNIDDLIRPESQIVWGRRGTGKTTLLKAFCYQINDLERAGSIACYIKVSECAPTGEELKHINNHDMDLTIYIFKKLLSKIRDFLDNFLDDKQYSTLSRKDRSTFVEHYCVLDDAVKIGSEIVVSTSQSHCTENHLDKGSGLHADFESTPHPQKSLT